MFLEIIENLPEELRIIPEQISLSPGNILLNQDEYSNFIYIVKRGTVKAYHTNEKGQEFLIGIFGSGELFGELEYFTGTLNFAFVESVTSCDLLRIPKDSFKIILENNSEFLSKISIALSERLLKISRRTVESRYYPLEFVIAKFIVNQATDADLLSVKFKKEELASYFGTNVRSINRILKRLCDLNLIALHKGELEIKSLNGLKNIYDGAKK